MNSIQNKIFVALFKASELALNLSKISTLLVQLVERWFPKPDVVGSSPTGRDFVK
jgi:hypothetical protein